MSPWLEAVGMLGLVAHVGGLVVVVVVVAEVASVVMRSRRR